MAGLQLGALDLGRGEQRLKAEVSLPPFFQAALHERQKRVELFRVELDRLARAHQLSLSNVQTERAELIDELVLFVHRGF